VRRATNNERDDSADAAERRVDATASEMERERAELEQRSEELGERIDRTREGWRERQRDTSVPGIVSPEDHDLDSDADPPEPPEVPG
jgi:hypothetical protein